MAIEVHTPRGQSIRTKLISPSNVRGSRVMAECQARRIYVEWDHRLNAEGNHRAAAEELCRRMDWAGEMRGAFLRDASCAFVFLD